MQPSMPLADKLTPIDDALARLTERVDAASVASLLSTDPDILVVLRGLTEVVRALAMNRWTDGRSDRPGA